MEIRKFPVFLNVNPSNKLSLRIQNLVKIRSLFCVYAHRETDEYLHIGTQKFQQDCFRVHIPDVQTYSSYSNMYRFSFVTILLYV